MSAPLPLPLPPVARLAAQIKPIVGEQPGQNKTYLRPGEAYAAGDAKKDAALAWRTTLNDFADKSGVKVSKLPVDGIEEVNFGPNTTKVTRMFQRWAKQNGVEVGDISGVVGPKTVAAAAVGQALGWKIPKDQQPKAQEMFGRLIDSAADGKLVEAITTLVQNVTSVGKKEDTVTGNGVRIKKLETDGVSR